MANHEERELQANVEALTAGQDANARKRAALRRIALALRAGAVPADKLERAKSAIRFGATAIREERAKAPEDLQFQGPPAAGAEPGESIAASINPAQITRFDQGPPVVQGAQEPPPLTPKGAVSLGAVAMMPLAGPSILLANTLGGLLSQYMPGAEGADAFFPDLPLDALTSLANELGVDGFVEAVQGAMQRDPEPASAGLRAKRDRLKAGEITPKDFVESLTFQESIEGWRLAFTQIGKSTIAGFIRSRAPNVAELTPAFDRDEQIRILETEGAERVIAKLEAEEGNQLLAGAAAELAVDVFSATAQAKAFARGAKVAKKSQQLRLGPIGSTLRPEEAFKMGPSALAQSFTDPELYPALREMGWFSQANVQRLGDMPADALAKTRESLKTFAILKGQAKAIAGNRGLKASQAATLQAEVSSNLFAGEVMRDFDAAAKQAARYRNSDSMNSIKNASQAFESSLLQSYYLSAGRLNAANAKKHQARGVDWMMFKLGFDDLAKGRAGSPAAIAAKSARRALMEQLKLANSRVFINNVEMPWSKLTRKQQRRKVNEIINTVANNAEFEQSLHLDTPFLRVMDWDAALNRQANPKTFDWLIDFGKKFVHADYLKDLHPRATRLINQVYDEAGLEVGDTYSRLRKPLYALTPDEKVEVVNALRGISFPQTESVASMTQLFRREFGRVGVEIARHGIKVEDIDGTMRAFHMRDNFFPQVWRDGALEQLLGSDPKLKRLMKVNNVKSLGEMRAMMQEFLKLKRNRRFGHIEYARRIHIPPDLQKELLEDDLVAIASRYFQSAWLRTKQAEHLGNDFQVLTDLAKDVAPHKRKYFTELAKRAAGQDVFSPEAQKFSEEMRALGVLTSMSRSGMNTFKSITSVASIARPGVNPIEWARQSRDFFRGWGQEGMMRAIKSGEVPELLLRSASDPNLSKSGSLMQKWAEQMLGGKVSLDFNKNEFRLRAGTISVLQGRASRYAQNLSKTRDISRWDRWQFDGLVHLLNDRDDELRAITEVTDIVRRQGGKLSGKQLNRIGQRSVNLTQPKRPTDVPHYILHPIGKVPGQFKTTMLKEWRILIHETILPATRRGDWRPLASFILSTQLIGEPIGYVGTWISGRQRPGWDRPAMRMMDNILNTSGAGLAWDVFLSVKFGRSMGVFHWAMGPVVARMAKMIDAMISDWSTGSFEKIPRTATQTVPVIGPKLADHFWPPTRPHERSMLEDVIEGR